MTDRTYAPELLARIRDLQALSHQCLLEVADRLEPGHTEREAAAMIDNRLRTEGVRAYFHVPFVWFGRRSAFVGVNRAMDFFPADEALQSGMAVILDVAPVLDGVIAGAAHSFCLGENEVARRAALDLRGFRSLIVERVRRGDAAGEVYRAVEDLLTDLGYRNCHRRYPFGLLGHRMSRHRVAVHPRVFGFSLTGVSGLLGRAVASRLPRALTSRVPALGSGTPFVNVGPGSEAPVRPGLWTFEPHIARDGVGAKFKEVLVVEEGRTRWLDDGLPHVRRWAEEGSP